MSTHTTQTSPFITPTALFRGSAIFALIALINTGCVISSDTDRYDDRYAEEEVYVEDEVYVDDQVAIDESQAEETEEVVEESNEEITEEEEETTTTTTTVVEMPGTEGVEAVTCSAEDQGFADAELVEASIILPAEGCTWRETSADLDSDTGLGFIDIEDNDAYIELFDCGEQSIISDVNWDEEVVIYLSGWVPAGSQPSFQWAVSGESGEVVLGLVSQEVCDEGAEFYQGAFVAPRREIEPRVISCIEPVDCE